MTCVSPVVKIPRTALRVVLGVFEVIDTFSPMMAFTKVDLPTLGRPIMVANPALVIRRPFDVE
jgi:hypothetical protein